jgi:hypothetical protein
MIDTMFRTTLAAAALATLLGAPAHAGVLTFDDLDTGGVLSSLAGKAGQYGGLTWSANFLLGDDGYAGYANGAHSGHNFVNNRNVRTLNVSSADGFDFAGAWFVAPQLIGGTAASWISIEAFDAAGASIGSTGQVAIGSDYRFVQAGFDGVHRLAITRDAGWYAMDDFTLADAELPEPGAWLSIGIGALALAAARRLRARP